MSGGPKPNLCLPHPPKLRLRREGRRRPNIQVLHKTWIRKRIISLNLLFFKSNALQNLWSKERCWNILQILTVHKSPASFFFVWIGHLYAGSFSRVKGAGRPDHLALPDSTAKFLHLHLSFRNKRSGKKKKWQSQEKNYCVLCSLRTRGSFKVSGCHCGFLTDIPAPPSFH